MVSGQVDTVRYPLGILQGGGPGAVVVALRGWWVSYPILLSQLLRPLSLPASVWTLFVLGKSWPRFSDVVALSPWEEGWQFNPSWLMLCPGPPAYRKRARRSIVRCQVEIFSALSVIQGGDPWTSDEVPRTFSPTLRLLKVLEIHQRFLIITRGTASPSGWSRGGGAGDTEVLPTWALSWSAEEFGI